MATNKTREHSLSRKIITGFSIGLVVACVVAFIAWSSLQQLVQTVTRVAEPNKALIALKQSSVDLSNAGSYVRAYSLTGDEDYLERYQQSMDKLIDRVEKLQADDSDIQMDAEGSQRANNLLVLVHEKKLVLDSLSRLGREDPTENVLNQVKESLDEELKTDQVPVAAPPVREPSTDNELPSEEFVDDPAKDGFSLRNIFRRKKNESEDTKVVTGQINRVQGAEQQSAGFDAEYSEEYAQGVPYQAGGTPNIDRLLRSIQVEESERMESLLETEFQLVHLDQQITDQILAEITALEEGERAKADALAESAASGAHRTTLLIAGLLICAVSAALFFIFLIIRDIRKSRRYNRNLIRARRQAERLATAKEEFLANMSHEIRTPMNAILGFSEQLQGTPLDKTQADFLRIIRQASDHLLVIVNDVLDLSKLEADMVELDKVAFSPFQVLEECIQVMQAEASRREISLLPEVAPDAKDRIALGDPGRLRQVLLNLMSNAVKFSPANGQIHLRMKLKAESPTRSVWVIEVEDNGIGIASDKLHLIFKEFTQANPNISNQYGGTGLGLAICNRIVQLHNGRISVDSEEGKGAIFTVQIPYGHATEEDLADHNPSEFAIRPMPGMKVLVVDDEDFNLLLAKTMLERWEMKVETARNGHQALSKLKSNSYDLILLDVRMPDISGLEVAREYRASHPGRQVPILALTAHAGRAERSRCLQAGMDEVLIKPYTEAELNSVIHKLNEDWGGIHNGLPESATVAPLPTEKRNSAMNHPKPEQSIELKGIMEMTGNNPQFLEKMLRIFDQNAQEAVDSLGKAISENDYETISHHAHKMVPSVRHLGAQNLSLLLKGIEQDCNQRVNLDELPTKVKDAIQSLRSLQQSAQAEIESLASQ